MFLLDVDYNSIFNETGKLYVTVFCLSLMRENWPEYIVEAKRCLARNGLIFIIETTKSSSTRLSELRSVRKILHLLMLGVVCLST